MFIFSLIAAVVLQQAPVEREIVVFQKDVPASHENGKIEYDRFREQDLFDPAGYPRTVGLVGCDKCQYRTIRMVDARPASWKVGDNVTRTAADILNDEIPSGTEYVFVGQEGEVTSSPAGYQLVIKDHAFDPLVKQYRMVVTGHTAMSFGHDGQKSWIYGPSIDQGGNRVMRLTVAWENRQSRSN